MDKNTLVGGSQIAGTPFGNRSLKALRNIAAHERHHKKHRVSKILDNLDIYAQPTQGFTIKGNEQMHSKFGLKISFIHVVLFLAFFSVKLVYVATSFNPNVAVYSRKRLHTNEEN